MFCSSDTSRGVLGCRCNNSSRQIKRSPESKTEMPVRKRVLLVRAFGHCVEILRPLFFISAGATICGAPGSFAYANLPVFRHVTVSGDFRCL